MPVTEGPTQSKVYPEATTAFGSLSISSTQMRIVPGCRWMSSSSRMTYLAAVRSTASKPCSWLCIFCEQYQVRPATRRRMLASACSRISRSMCGYAGSSSASTTKMKSRGPPYIEVT